MIVTVTPNPAMDVVYTANEFRPGRWFRAKEAIRAAGGRGVNVSIMLKQLGFDSIATGFLGGHTGNFIRSELLKRDISTNFVNVEGESRSNTYIHEMSEMFDGVETVVTDAGPRVPESAQRRFFWKLDRLMPRATAVHIGGSLPQGVPDEFCRDAVDAARRLNIPVFLDTYGPPMDRALEALPTVVKIDHRSINTVRNITQSALDHLIEISKRMFDEGVDWVITSYFNHSSVFCTTKGFYMGELNPERISTVRAAGDALMTGMIVAREDRMGVEDTVRFAMACVTANVGWQGKGIEGGRPRVEELMGEITVSKL